MRYGLLCIAIFLTQAPENWDRADRATNRIQPSSFVELPTAIRTDLERRGCTIPQTYAANRRENVIRGRFTSANGTDWAVLCSINRESSILVYRGGEPTDVAELARQADRDFLQTINGAGTIGFSREIDVAGVVFIRDRNKLTEGTSVPPIDHEGIDDVFIEKASVVWYWHDGRWLTLLGRD